MGGHTRVHRTQHCRAKPSQKTQRHTHRVRFKKKSMVHLLKHFQSYDTIVDLMFDCDYAEYCISKGSITMTEEEFYLKRADFVRTHLLALPMNAHLMNALCHFVLWMYGCSTVKEYEERLNEVAESMNIEHIAFLGGFDNVKQRVWDERLDDHLHRSPVFYPVEKPFETLASSAPAEHSSYASTPPFSMNL